MHQQICRFQLFPDNLSACRILWPSGLPTIRSFSVMISAEVNAMSSASITKISDLASSDSVVLPSGDVQAVKAINSVPASVWSEISLINACYSS
jgi:hypothetical protein